MYPRNEEELAEYLRHHSVLTACFPARQAVYTFKASHGTKIEFFTEDDRVITLHVDRGSIEYHANGFTRRVGGFVATFLYMGNKLGHASYQARKTA
jgi:hypothetical protein